MASENDTPTLTPEEPPVAAPAAEEEVTIAAERASADEVLISSALDPVIKKLRQPPAPEAVKFKIQTNPYQGNLEKKALIVAYIDSRFCSDRLNVVAPGMWDEEPLPMPHVGPNDQAAGVLCAVTLKVPLTNGSEHAVTHVDVGTSNTVKTEMGLKALYSDAFKRACVKFGIGAVLYAAPKLYIKGADLEHWGPEGKDHKFKLSDRNIAYCRREYAKFLKSVEDIYGPPLSHGDAADGAGDIDVEDYGAQERETRAAGPPFGPPADDKLTSQFSGALTYLLDDLEAASELHGKILSRCGGYLPDVVARCIGITAGAVKAADDAREAAVAHAELDAAADAAAGAVPQSAPEPEAPAAEPAAAPAAEDTTTPKEA